MKYIMRILLITLITLSTIQAQTIRFGTKAGANFATMTEIDGSEAKF